MDFYNRLITWYLANKRDLPWRKTTNPYHIWLSEIILQQTRVAQGLPYFQAFIKQFPKVSDLANASQEQVLKLWQGLGYYSRARNLHETAKYITTDLNGKFPDNYNDLLALKGVGEYTAAAIASFAFNEKIGVVDGNVFRVLARIFDISDDISVAKTRKLFQNLSNELLFEHENADPALFNQAIMDFGAMQCVPKSPDCLNCPFKDHCKAYERNKVTDLPVKLSKTKITKRYFDFVILKGDDNTIEINQRINKGIWEGLFEFPLFEFDKEKAIDEVELLIKEHFVSYNIKQLYCFDANFLIHKLSHQHLHIRFWKLDVANMLEKTPLSDLDKFAYPIVLANFIEKNYEKL